MASGLGYTPKIEFIRPRQLTAREDADPLTRHTSDAAESKELAEQQFNDLEKVLSKARRLEQALEAVGPRLSIPVPPNAVDVRAAVLRQDSESRGIQISFQLYLAALEARETVEDVLSPELLTELTGNTATDSQTILHRRLSAQTGMARDEAVLVLSQIFHLLVLQLMQHGFQAMEAGKQTSPKFPEGVEVIPIASSVLMSTLFTLAYSANSQEQAKRVLQELIHPKVNADNVFKQLTDTEIVLPPLAQLAIKAKRPSDMELIRQFSFDFLARTDQIGYEPWVLAQNVRFIRRDLERAKEARPRYVLKGQPYTKTSQLLTQTRINHHNQSLDAVRQALSSPLGQTAAVSLSGFFSVMTPAGNLAASNTLQVVLSNTGKSIDGSIVSTSFNGVFAVAEPLLQNLLGAMNGQVGTLLRWVSAAGMVALQERSPAVDEFTHFLFQGASQIERTTLSLVQSIYQTVRASNADTLETCSEVVTRRRARLYLNVLKFAREMRSAGGFNESSLVHQFEVADGTGRIDLPTGDDPLLDFQPVSLDSPVRTIAAQEDGSACTQEVRPPELPPYGI